MLGTILCCLIIGYLFGCIQTGYLYAKAKGVDIRKYGSGNSGATNTLRVMGKKAGVITYVGDALKAVLASLLVRFVIFPDSSMGGTLLTALTGLGVVLGHNYPFYLKFKGGKGIAVTSAVVIMIDWRIAIPLFFVFTIVAYVTRYVSVASLSTVTLVPILIAIFHWDDKGVIVVSVILVVFAWIRHRENVKRLIAGTENRFGSKKKE